MTEQDFKLALDKLVIDGINQLGASVVLSNLAVVSRFTEVAYDVLVVQVVDKMYKQQAEVICCTKQQEETPVKKVVKKTTAKKAAE